MRDSLQPAAPDEWLLSRRCAADDVCLRHRARQIVSDVDYRGKLAYALSDSRRLGAVASPDQDSLVVSNRRMTFDQVSRQGSRPDHQKHFWVAGRQEVGGQS